MASDAVLQDRPILFGLGVLDATQNANHFAVNIMSNLAAPPDHPVHVVLHMGRRSNRRLGKEGLALMDFIGAHKVRCRELDALLVDLICIEYRKLVPQTYLLNLQHCI